MGGEGRDVLSKKIFVCFLLVRRMEAVALRGPE